jgi:hypothetical protein
MEGEGGAWGKEGNEGGFIQGGEGAERERERNGTG